MKKSLIMLITAVIFCLNAAAVSADLIWDPVSYREGQESSADSGDIDQIYPDFLNYLKEFLTGAETEPAGPYKSLESRLYEMKRENWDTDYTGYALIDIDGDGINELLLGNYKYDQLYDVFTIVSGQLTGLLHSGYKKVIKLNTDGTFSEEDLVSAFSSTNFEYTYTNGKLTQHPSAPENNHTAAVIEYIPLSSFSPSAEAPAVPVSKTQAKESDTQKFSFEHIDDSSCRITGYDGDDKTVIIPSHGSDGCRVTEIGTAAFSRSTGLSLVIIPEGVTSIGELAFSLCTDLAAVTLPDSLISIGDFAFAGCTGLTSMTVPESVTAIGDDTFSMCGQLELTVIQDSYAEQYAAEKQISCSTLPGSDFLYIVQNDGSAEITGYKGKDQDVIIPPDISGTRVSSVGIRAFAGNQDLTSVTISEGITVIRDQAFALCSSLTSVKLPDSIISIGDQAFARCSSLTSINLPKGTGSIGSYAFSECSKLKSVKIPAAVYYIGVEAFDPATEQVFEERNYGGHDLNGERVGACPMPTYLRKGGMAHVKDSIDSGLNIRETPGGAKTGVQAFPQNNKGPIWFLIEDGPVCKDNKVWYRVNFIGHHGWIAEGEGGEYYLEGR